MSAPTADAVSVGFDDLAAALHGDLITPDDPGYDEARAVYNGMIDRRPGGDRPLPRRRRRRDLRPLRPRARPRHSPSAAAATTPPASAVWDGALVIDLSQMRSATVDPRDHTVRVDGGCTWGDVDHATVGVRHGHPVRLPRLHRRRRAHPRRRHRLPVPPVRPHRRQPALRRRRARRRQLRHGVARPSTRDLFWALRGGGGNFGVVTSFTFRSHDIGENGTVIGGPVLYDLADTPEVMRWYRELLPSLPEELSGWIGLLTIPPAPPFPEELWGRKACGIVWCYTGPHDRADDVLDPVRQLRVAAASSGSRRCRSRRCRAPSTRCTRPVCSGTGGPTCSRRSPTRPSTCTRSSAPGCPPATRRCTCTRSTARRHACRPTRRPFAYRDGGWAGVIVGVDPDPANAGRSRPGRATTATRCTRSPPAAPTSTSWGTRATTASAPPTAATTSGSPRSSGRYDPENVFHVNQNIPPAPRPE